MSLLRIPPQKFSKIEIQIPSARDGSGNPEVCRPFGWAELQRTARPKPTLRFAGRFGMPPNNYNYFTVAAAGSGCLA